MIGREAADGAWVNIIAVREEDEDRPWVKQLIDAYHSDEVKAFLEKRASRALTARPGRQGGGSTTHTRDARVLQKSKPVVAGARRFVPVRHGQRFARTIENQLPALI